MGPESMYWSLTSTYGPHRKVCTKTRKTGPSFWAHWPRATSHPCQGHTAAGGRLQLAAACQPCRIPQTGSAKHMEQRSWPHLCAGRHTHSNILHLHLPQLVPRASEASQAPSLSWDWEGGRREGTSQSLPRFGQSGTGTSPKNHAVLLRTAPPPWRQRSGLIALLHRPRKHG